MHFPTFSGACPLWTALLLSCLLASCDSQSTDPAPIEGTDPVDSWTWQNPAPQGNSLFAVESFGESTWITPGGPSRLLRSRDDGRSWDVIEIPTTLGVYDLTASDSQTGYALSWSGEVLQTVDGGQTWNVKSKLDVSYPYGILSSDGATVIVFGGLGIYRSIDGGSHFDLVQGARPVTGMSFLDESTGIAVGYRGLVMKTVDGGATWEAQENPFEAELKAVDWVTESIVIAAGEDGAMLHSGDAGRSWNVMDSGTDRDLDMIRFFDTAWGIAVGGTIICSSNAGFDWRPASLEQGPPWFDAAGFDDQGTALAVGRFGVLAVSNDRGASWSPLSSGNRSELRAVHFADDVVGTAVGEDGAILRSEDGGRTWFEQSAGTAVDFEDVWLTDASSGVIVGHDDVVLYTRDAGASWQQAQVEILYDGFYRLFFVTADLGYASSWSGEIYRTVDGGMSWELRSDPRGPIGPYFALNFLDAELGYLSDSGGGIWQTRDGGVTWNEPEFFNASRRYDHEFDEIVFFDRDHGLAAGPSGLTLETTDGGDSWGFRSVQSLSAKYGMATVPGTDTAYAVGAFGRVDVTLDRGETWELLPRFAYSELFDLAILSDAIIVVGSGGTIIRREL